MTNGTWSQKTDMEYSIYSLFNQIILSPNQIKTHCLHRQRTKEKEAYFLWKKKKILLWQPLRVEVNSGDYQWGALWVWSNTDIIHPRRCGGGQREKERERTGQNHTLLTSVMTSVKTVWWVETLSTSKANIRLGAALVCLWMGEWLPNICCSALFLSTWVQPLLIDCCSSPTSHVWIELCLGRSSVKSLFWSPLSGPSVWKQGTTTVWTNSCKLCWADNIVKECNHGTPSINFTTHLHLIALTPHPSNY